MHSLVLAVRYCVRRLLPFVIAYFLFEVLEVSVLIVREFPNLHTDALGLLRALCVWLGTTTASCLFSLVPILLYLVCLPQKRHGGTADKWISLALFFLYANCNLFEEVSELLFWDEFTSRFNFVAVDYLVYTQEVIGNIMQSYPVAWYLSGIFLASLVLTVLFRRWLAPEGVEVPRLLPRFSGGVAVVALACAINTVPWFSLSDNSENRYLSELSRDGLFSLFHAFFANELDYDDFYLTLPESGVLATLSPKLDAGMTRTGDPASLAYVVQPQGPEKRLNVMIVLMESMGSEFFSEFRTDGQRLTPELEKLAEASLYFSHTYATGTRTVRGIEALTLGCPPLPGMSIVRREGNENLFGIGSVFQDKGYETKWIYGGYGYFDNMNAFFRGNGFAVIDRTVLSRDEISFANVWGVCDEDLFRRVVREADASHAAGKPFLNVMVTTSNHRPYTYPEGRIPIAPKTGRRGGVMYADYAVGQFIREARKHPWFDDTVFVFVADHGAGSAGRDEIQVGNHHIPLIIYSPKHIAPARYDMPISQIDATPTLLAQLNMAYEGRFYGRNALDPNYVSRFFLSNYQKLGYVRGTEAVLLSPVRNVHFYRDKVLLGSFDVPAGAQPTAPDAAMQRVLEEAVSSYQHASHWRENLKREKNGESR